MKFGWPAVLLTGAAGLGAGYAFAPREILDNEVTDSGFFRVDTSEVLSSTVESLRAENSLVVWSYKGTSSIKATRTSFWVFKGEQQLIVPYTVDYRLNLSELTLDKVEYNERAKIVTVRLPKLRLSDVAFQPEQATTINGGILSYSDATVQALGKLAYRTARKAAVKQAQQRSMVNVAKGQAKKNVRSLFEIPLRIAGHPDVKVVAIFD